MLTTFVLALTACQGQPYAPDPAWAALRDVGPTHGGVAIDRAGNVYVSTDRDEGILVFAPDGTRLRAIAADYHGSHSLLLREEEGEEFLYAAHLHGHQVVKLRLDGTPVWTIPAPADGFNPTSVAVAPDGSIFVADGYGSSFIYKFDRERRLVKQFGGPGELNGPHGIAIDRDGRLLVADRENRRLVRYSLDGEMEAVLAVGLRRPGGIAFFGDVIAVGELEARVLLMDRQFQPILELGDNPNGAEWADYNAAGHDDVFCAPHSVCFDRDGNLYVQEWNRAGRLHKLVRAPLSLAPLFRDHMVLQRDREVPVWGWGAPGARVEVRFAGSTVTTKVGADGCWSVKIGPFAAGGPHELEVNDLVVRDVLVGDVWVCSGQSNMEWPVAASANADAEIAAADHPTIRLFTVPKSISATPRAMTNGAWTPCTPDTVRDFSAVAYFFGREFGDVPIGLIDASWGGTPCESWTSADALRELPDFAPAVERMERILREPVAPAVDAGTADPDADVSAWKVLELPGHWERALPDFDGAVWFRRDVELPAEWAGRDAVLTLGAIDDMDVTWINGQRVGGLEGAGHWNTPRRYDVPGAVLRAGRNVIVVRVVDTGGPGGFSGKPEEMALSRDGASIGLAGDWRYLPFHMTPPVAVSNQNSPTALYNGMIAPLAPYGIRGAIWYQGESNASRAAQYRALFPAMIRDWRARWGQGDFAFLFVQLANFMAAKPEPSESAWAELREAQASALSLPNTGMAVAIDIGDAGDIHPRNKQEVGRRLAAAARGESGPLYKRLEIEGDAIRLWFDHGPPVADGELRGFAIAGEDGRFVWAAATIDGETVVVRGVPSPRAVRYAWADNPEGCNLVNVAGLPASPFRTDSPR